MMYLPSGPASTRVLPETTLAPGTGLPSGPSMTPDRTFGTSLMSTVPLPVASIVCGEKPSCATDTIGESGILSKWNVPSAVVVAVIWTVGVIVAVIGTDAPADMATGTPGMDAPE